MKFWILACGAPAIVAALVIYRTSARRTRHRGRVDQVSGDWLAASRIHEDQN